MEPTHVPNNTGMSEKSDIQILTCFTTAVVMSLFEALTTGLNELSVQWELPNKVHPPLFCECFLQ